MEIGCEGYTTLSIASRSERSKCRAMRWSTVQGKAEQCALHVLGPPWPFLGQSCRVLERYWDHLGAFSRPLGLWALVERSRAVSEPRGPLGKPPVGPLGSLVGACQGLWGPLGVTGSASFGHLESVFRGGAEASETHRM